VHKRTVPVDFDAVRPFGNAGARRVCETKAIDLPNFRGDILCSDAVCGGIQLNEIDALVSRTCDSVSEFDTVCPASPTNEVVIDLPSTRRLQIVFKASVDDHGRS